MDRGNPEFCPEALDCNSVSYRHFDCDLVVGVTLTNAFLLTLIALLLAFILADYAEYRQRVNVNSQWIVELEGRFDTESRPLIIQQRYGYVEIFGEEVIPE